MIRVDGTGCAARATREKDSKDNDNAKLKARKRTPNVETAFPCLSGSADGRGREDCKSWCKLA
jgi:hypothetical protein